MNKTLITAVVVGVASTFIGTWLYAQYAASKVTSA